MPQMQLPMYPDGVTHITGELAFMKSDGQVTYFNGQMPVFVHDADDVRTFRMITSQFCVNGNAKQSEIARAFGVSLISVKRWVKVYREKGPAGFYAPRPRRGPAVLTAPVLECAQALLDEGRSVTQVAQQLGLKRDTLAKAVAAGRLHKAVKKRDEDDERAPAPASKSDRSAQDSTALMGMGASNIAERVAASVGELDEVAIEFKPSLDVPRAGVLLALPALLGSGLLCHAREYFHLPKGYYGLQSIFLLLAFMALARMKSVEALRYCAPGEWGKVLGLDRVPEVRTLRQKLALLSEAQAVQGWSAELCAQWMHADPQSTATLYIDGHVRVYHGRQTPLPKHYVARQKLCLRATADYWVNAMDGQPFMLVHPPVDPGLIKVLEHEIVPRLEREVPDQPSEAYLEANPLAHRFTLVFDREGYSPAFFLRMRKRRIACITYRKRCPEDWPGEEFQPREVELASGQRVVMHLAERGVLLGAKLWVREVRKRSEGGHQTAIVTTDYVSDLGGVACAMFARWSQENFFKYMREHYALDRLVDYQTEEIPATTKVVNPAHRKLDGQVRRQVAVLNRLQAKFGALNLAGDIEPTRVAEFQSEKAELQDQIDRLQGEVEQLEAKRKVTPRHLSFEELPEEAKFERLRVHSKHLIDTIKMIAYRAETAMAYVLRETMSRPDDARTLLRALYSTEADLLPDESNNILTVRLHHQANASTDAGLKHLCDELNSTETAFPGTNLRLIYELVSSQIRRDQEV